MPTCTPLSLLLMPIRWGRWVAGAMLLLAVPLGSARECSAQSPYGQLEYEAVSEYSHLRIRYRNNLRTMLFVRDTKQEVVESILDLGQPQRLVIPYTQYMFLSYAYQPQPKRVLIVGLGGGSMVHFLRHVDPQLKVDVVEIDPEVVAIASRYFGVGPDTNVKVITMDAFKYLADETPRYDVIYMDAFLKPSEETDATGKPLNLKTTQFYRDIQSHLTDDGLVVFNMNHDRQLRDDLATLAKAFANVYPFVLPQRAGVVAIGSTSPTKQSTAVTLKRARELDKRFDATFSFEKLARRYQR